MPTLSSNSCWRMTKSPLSTENLWQILKEAIRSVMEKLLRIYWMILKNLPNQAQWLKWISLHTIMVTKTSMVSSKTILHKLCRTDILTTMGMALTKRIEKCTCDALYIWISNHYHQPYIYITLNNKRAKHNNNMNNKLINDIWINNDKILYAWSYIELTHT